MGTPGLRLIQDLLAKSVAKWSGDAIKSTKDEMNTNIKIETKNIKVEYIENVTVPLDDKIELKRMKEENFEVGLKRKLIEPETDISGKKKKKARKAYGICGSKIENIKYVTEDILPDKKDDKSLICRLLENSAAKFAANGDDHHNRYYSDEKKRKTMKICKKEIGIKNEANCKVVIGNEGKVSNQVPDNKNTTKRLTNPLMENCDDERQNATGVKKEIRTNEKAKHMNVKTSSIEKHKTKALHRKINTQMRRFTPEEDELLQHAIDTLGESLNLKNLADELGRDQSSVRCRIRKLKTGIRQIVKKEFSMVEDMLIMDRMLERLPGRKLKDLEMLKDSTTEAFLTKLGRVEHSGTSRRWGIIIKPWILQHYAGTLNLDINKMLANFIADTFDNFESIDWDLVVGRPEFSGQTGSTLKCIYSRLYMNTTNRQDIEPAEVTLRNIADNTDNERVQWKKVREKVLIRQKQVIDYFEQFVKKHGITDIL